MKRGRKRFKSEGSKETQKEVLEVVQHFDENWHERTAVKSPENPRAQRTRKQSFSDTHR
jgi:hypothetical protein